MDFHLLSKSTQYNGLQRLIKFIVNMRHGFTIYYFDDYTIETNYKHRYIEFLNKFRKLDKKGWLC